MKDDADPGAAWTDAGFDGTGNTLTLSGLQRDIPYQAQVKAHNPEGSSDWSQTGEGRTLANIPPVLPGNDQPIERSVNENAATGSPVGDAVTADDTDIDDEGKLQYSLEGSDAIHFDIEAATGQMAVKDPLDHENKDSYQVTVRVVDGQTGNDTVTVNIAVTDLLEKPDTPAAPTVEEGQHANTLDVTWTEPGNTGPAMSNYHIQYRKSDETTWERWPQPPSTDIRTTITGLLTDTGYQVQVQAYNDELWSDWSNPGAGRTAANSPPVFSDGATTERGVAETPGGQTENADRAVGDAVAATDADGDAITYALGGTDAASFDIDDGTGQIRTKTGRSYDYETKRTYNLEVSARDGPSMDQGHATIQVTVTIDDIDEPPVKMDTPTFSNTDRHQTTVSWTAPDNTGRPVISRYRVRYGKNVTNPIYTEKDAGTGLTLTVMELDDGQEYRFQVQAKNAEGDSPWSDARSVSTLANKVPVFQDGSSAGRGLPENSGAGTLVGNPLTATDGDGDTLTYSIDSTNDGEFTINPATGQLESGDHDYNHEAADHHIITVVATDGKGGRGEIEVRINITDLNEAPDQPENMRVTQVSSIELKADWDKPNNDGRPAISGYDVQYRKDLDTAAWADAAHTGTSTQGPITGLQPSTTYQVQVKTVNHEGSSGWTQVSKGTTSPNNPPVFAQGSSATRSVPENSQADTNVGTPVTATDFEDTPLTYSLQGTDADSFQIDDASGQITTKAGVDYNHEVKSSYSLTVKADDGHSGGKSIPVTVNITDVNEPPGDPAAPTVTAGTAPRSLDVSWAAPANTGPDINGYDLQYRQNEATTPWSDWSNTGVNQSALITGLVAGKTYQAQVKAKNLEGKSEWSAPGSGDTSDNVPPNFTDDRGSGTTTRAMTETIGDADDTGRNVGTPITATDTDGGTITYALEGTDAAHFDIDPLTGQISTKSDNKYDFETKTSYNVTVTADDDQEQPERTKTIAVTINITDVDEPPVKMATPTFSDTGRYETTVKWAKPNNTGRPAITKYQLRYGKNVTDPIYTVVDAGTGVKDTIDELDDGVDYRFEVRAVNAEGDGIWSNVGIVSTPGQQAAGHSPTASARAGACRRTRRKTPTSVTPSPPPTRTATPGNTPSPARTPARTPASSPSTQQPGSSSREITTTTTRPHPPTR